MAEEKDAEKDEKDGAEEGAKKGGGLKRIIILAVVCLVIVGISVGGTLTVLKMTQPPAVPVEGEEGAAEPVEEVKKDAIYFPIKPEIIVNYTARGRQRYLRTDITLLIRDVDVIAAIETHMPMIRNTLNMIIGGQVYQEIQTAEGKELMRQQCLQALRKNLEAEIGKPGIEEVLFTSFVMQ